MGHQGYRTTCKQLAANNRCVTLFSDPVFAGYGQEQGACQGAPRGQVCC